MTTSPNESASRYPALYGEPVTEAHARICAEQGHATHTVDGEDSGTCPRCGEVKGSVAGALRAEMARRQVTTRELAARLGVSHSWVARRAAGDVPITPDTAQRLADALGIDPAVLLTPTAV